jgi:hypothetical protein
MTDHILIAGTGRAGTTLLVQVFTLLGFDTGYSEEQALRGVDDISKAGLEHCVLGEPDLPQVIKSPWLSDQIEDALDRGLRVSVAIIPLRDLFEAAESRRHVYRLAMSANLNALAHPGSLWKVKDPMEQESVLAVELYRFLEPLVARNVPIVFLSFPRFAEDAGYFYDQLSSIFEQHGVSREMAHAVHKRIADPSLVHHFSPRDRALGGRDPAPDTSPRHSNETGGGANRTREAALGAVPDIVPGTGRPGGRFDGA